MTQPPSSNTSRLSGADLIKLKRYLIDSLSRGMESEDVLSEHRSEFIQQHLKDVYNQAHLNLSEDVQRMIFQDVQNDMMGLGPIQPLLDDPDVSEIMVNGPKNVYVEKQGQLVRTNVTFDDDAHVMQIIDRIILPLGRRVDPDSPTVDARLPDGSRVNAVISADSARRPFDHDS